MFTVECCLLVLICSHDEIVHWFSTQGIWSKTRCRSSIQNIAYGFTADFRSLVVLVMDSTVLPREKSGGESERA